LQDTPCVGDYDEDDIRFCTILINGQNSIVHPTYILRKSGNEIEAVWKLVIELDVEAIQIRSAKIT